MAYQKAALLYQDLAVVIQPAGSWRRLCLSGVWTASIWPKTSQRAGQGNMLSLLVKGLGRADTLFKEGEKTDKYVNKKVKKQISMRMLIFLMILWYVLWNKKRKLHGETWEKVKMWKMRWNCSEHALRKEWRKLQSPWGEKCKSC